MSTSEPINSERDLKQTELDAAIRREELQEKREARLAEQGRHRVDAELRRREIELEHGRGLKFSSSQATVAAAVIALVSGLLGGLVQGWFTKGVEADKSAALIKIEGLKADAGIALERQKQEATERLERAKFETTLILKATEAPNRSDQIRNLKFFLNAGFISDPQGKIASINVQDFPSTLPESGYLQRRPHLIPVTQLVGDSKVASWAKSIGAVEVQGQQITTGWLIDSTHVLTFFTENVTFTPSELTFHLGYRSKTDQGEKFAIKKVVSKNDKLYFALLELDRSAGERYPPLPTFTRTAVYGERVLIIQHSVEVTGASVSEGDCVITAKHGDNGPTKSSIYYTCDSGLGSAGAPVIAVRDGAVLGLHFGGDATSGIGTDMQSILADPQVAQAAENGRKTTAQ